MHIGAHLCNPPPAESRLHQFNLLILTYIARANQYARRIYFRRRPSNSCTLVCAHLRQPYFSDKSLDNAQQWWIAVALTITREDFRHPHEKLAVTYTSLLTFRILGRNVRTDELFITSDIDVFVGRHRVGSADLSTLTKRQYRHCHQCQRSFFSPSLRYPSRTNIESTDSPASQ